jgi:hypothetical protein
VPSYRYIKSRYKRLYIKRGLYEKLQALAEKEGLTVPSLIEKLYSMYISPNITPNTDGSGSATSITPNIRGNITPNTAHGNTINKCFDKAKMSYPVESYVAFYRSKGVLVDWWEEGENKV